MPENNGFTIPTKFTVSSSLNDLHKLKASVNSGPAHPTPILTQVHTSPQKYVHEPSVEKENKESKEKKEGKGEIVIRLNTRKTVKTVFILVLLIAVFCLGRFTAQSDSTERSTISITGWATHLFTADDTEAAALEVTPPTSVVAITNSTTSATAAAVETDSASTTSNTTRVVAEEENETIVTKYTTVVIALRGVQKKWLETYSKITALDYTLKNGEEGTVKPAYFIMEVEGYDDFEKKVPLPLSQQKVSSGKTVEPRVGVPGGFAISNITAGDLKQVDITLTLYDASDKQIAMVKSTVDVGQ